MSRRMSGNLVHRGEDCDHVGGGRMDRRSWTGFLLIAAGFLAIGGDAPAKPQAWSLFSDGHPRAQVAPVGTVDPYQGAVEALSLIHI